MSSMRLAGRKMGIVWMGALMAAALQAACKPAPPPATPPLHTLVFAAQKTFKPAWSYHYQGRLPCRDCDYVAADLVLDANAEFLLVARAVINGEAGPPVMRQGGYHVRPDGLVMLDGRGQYWVLAAENGRLSLGGGQAALSIEQDGELCHAPL